MKLFGEYLLEKKVLTPDQLLGCLVAQVREMPSIASVVFDRKLLSPEAMLKVFSHQAHTQLEFRPAAIALGFWTESIAATVLRELQAARTPIGQWIVRQGICDFKTITANLDEFLATEVGEHPSQNPPFLKAVAPSALPQAPPLKAPVAVEAPATSLVFDLGGEQVEQSLLSDYLEMANDDLRSELEQCIVAWEIDCKVGAFEKVEANFRTVYRQYHTVKGGARFIKAPVTEKLIHQSEELLSYCQKKVSALSPDNVEFLTALNLKVVDLIWELRNALARDFTEANLWQQQGFKDKYTQLHTQLAQTLADWAATPSQPDEDIEGKF